MSPTKRAAKPAAADKPAAKPRRPATPRGASELRIDQPRDGRWPVTSLRPDGSRSRYWVDPNSLRCDCPAGRRRSACKHLRAVLDHLEGRPTS